MVQGKVFQDILKLIFEKYKGATLLDFDDHSDILGAAIAIEPEGAEPEVISIIITRHVGKEYIVKSRK